jgi:hypothetical protein
MAREDDGHRHKYTRVVTFMQVPNACSMTSSVNGQK